MKSDVYQVVTDRVIMMLEAGTVPWRRPWKGIGQTPRNLVSRKAYRGINLFLLHAAGFASPFWLTFNQALSVGGCVKKGERSLPVVFWKMLEIEEDGQKKLIPFLRYHRAFNLAQCEGVPPPFAPATAGEIFPIGRCETVVANMPSPPVIEHGGQVAAYSPIMDRVRMPAKDSFESSEAYYGTLFHELTHSTGHSTRLSRKEITEPIRFGEDPYSREELVAEMGAAFLCGHCEIEVKTLDQSASYIQHWLAHLKNDHRLVVQAASLAQKACDFILDLKAAEVEPVEEQGPRPVVEPLREAPVPYRTSLRSRGGTTRATRRRFPCRRSASGIQAALLSAAGRG